MKLIKIETTNGSFHRKACTKAAMRVLFFVLILVGALTACQPPPETGFRSSKGMQDVTMPFECSGTFLAAFSEACNGLDDDCDGATDEGLSNCIVQPDELPFRLCSARCCVDDRACSLDTVCQKLGEQGRCEPSCDDGEFRLCSFGCESTFQECVGGYWSRCQSQRPDQERCNALDDDCDGDIDENAVCSIEMDVSVLHDMSESVDLGVSDVAVSIDQDLPDLSMDAAMAVDMMVTAEPRCRQHSDCPSLNLCLDRDCAAGLPGTFNVVIQSARVSELGNLSLYAELKRGDIVLGTTARAASDDATPNWGHRIQVDLAPQQILEVCVSDHDGFLNSDDLAGCAQFSSETVVEVIRSFSGTRSSPNWASFKPIVASGCCLDEVFLHVDRF